MQGARVGAGARGRRSGEWQARRRQVRGARAARACGRWARGAGGSGTQGARHERGRRTAWALGARPGRVGWPCAVHSVHSTYFRSVLTRFFF